MGWTVLYIAFGCVALWLLGEVLLQYKARLRWRLLAFCGFLCVVLGVLMSELLVILVGTAAFGTGQLFVTLSFRRGFSTGWALGGKPGSSRRRRSEAPAGDVPPPAVDSEPVLEVSQLEETAAYQPLPMPDDTGQYGVYDRDEPHAPSAPPMGGYATADSDALSNYDTGGYDPLGGGYGVAAQGTPAHGTPTGEWGTPVYGDTGPPAYSSPLYSAAPSGQPYTDPYASDSDQYASYADPYGGTQSGTGYGGYPGANDLYDPLGGGYPADTGSYPTTSYSAQGGGYDTGQYPADPYAQQTPPDGVWVPPQREPDPQYPQPTQDTGGYGHYDPQRP